MPAPTIADPASDPIEIDPLTPYTYVIPASDYTSLGYTPDDDFDISLADRTLTITYTGAFLSTPTTFPIVIFASSDDGIVEQTLNFKVRAYASFAVKTLWGYRSTTSSTDLSLHAGVQNPAPPALALAGILSVGDVVHWDAGFPGGGAGPYYYVVYVSGTVFRIANTAGGSAITCSAGTGPASLQIDLTLQNDANNNIRISGGDYVDGGFVITGSDNLTVGACILLYFGSLQLPFGPVGSYHYTPVYVKTIVDIGHITVSLTRGGGTYTPGTNRLLDDGITVRHYNRLIPDIDSDPEEDLELNEALSYAVTTDITADVIFAEGLPSGLAIAAGTIAGAPIESGTFMVKLLALKDGYTYIRYLVIAVAESSSSADAGQDVYLDLLTGLIYASADVLRAFTPKISVGDRPLRVHLLNGTIRPDPTDPTGNPGVLNFAANAQRSPAVSGSATIYDGDHVVEGSVEIQEIPGEDQVIVVGEDWSDARLLALFTAEQDEVSLVCQYESRNGTDGADAFRRYAVFQIIVTNTLFWTDVTPGASTLGIGRQYVFAITADFPTPTSPGWLDVKSLMLPAGIYAFSGSLQGNNIADDTEIRLFAASALVVLADCTLRNPAATSDTTLSLGVLGGLPLLEDDPYAGDGGVISNPAAQLVKLQINRYAGATGALKAGSYVILTRIG